MWFLKFFKLIFNHVESFHRKSLFYTCFKKSWVVENSFPVVTKLSKINTKKKPPKLYHIIYDNSHILLIKVLSEVIIFSFKSETRSCLSFWKIASYWASNDTTSKLLHNNWWWLGFFCKQIYLPQVIRTKTWTSRGTCNIRGYAHN